MSILEGKPKKLTEEDVRGYDTSEKLDMEFPPRKIALPKEWERQEPITIHRQHLDFNHHVNNCQYISMAEDYLEGSFSEGLLRVEYKQQGLLGDIFYPFIHREKVEEGEKVIVVFNQEEEIEKPKPYAVVEFTRKV